MKRLQICIVLLLSLMIFNSCKRETDRIFSENAAHKLQASVENAYNVLQGSEGTWLMKYYPNADLTFGGYTIFLKFNSNSSVTLTSDIDSRKITSDYSILSESGPVLTFNSFNKIIHYFSEPGNDSGIGPADSGMGGDFEFIVVEATPELVTLKGKKTGNTIILEPLKGNEFETVSKSYQEEFEFFDSFGTFTLEDKNGEVQDLTFSDRTFKETKDPFAPLLTFRLAIKGLDFYKEYDLGGEKVKELTYVAPTEAYPLGYYTNSSATIKVIPKAMPLNMWFRNNLWATSYSNIGATGKIYWDNAKTNLTNNNYTLDNFYVGTYSGIVGFVYVMQGGALAGLITHNINPVAGTDDRVTISLAGSIYNLGGGFNAAPWSAGLNQITTPFNNRTFVITSDNPAKPNKVMLTDIALPTNTYIFYLDDINDPFNN